MAGPVGPGDLLPAVAARLVARRIVVTGLGVVVRDAMATTVAASAHEPVAATAVETTGTPPVAGPERVTHVLWDGMAGPGGRTIGRTVGVADWLPRVRDCLSLGFRTR